eukprot:Phypoly_transcript_11123.p1 GENE.Phypoly_transcript_11123~~Phypoly_transcript_11123.p1  ORF type:complete len:368 (+),score=56.11 Phypoly_transcript_11123:90-1106(+)
MRKGFGEDEVAAWFTQNNFFPDVDKTDAEYCTNSMPLELQYLLEVAVRNGGTAGDEGQLNVVISRYVQERNAEYSALQTKFEQEYCTSQELLNSHINAIVWMELGVSLYRTGSYLLNQHFMFVEDVIHCTTPIVERFLTDRYKESYHSIFNAVAQMIFKAPLSEFGADTKGRTFERYVISKFVEEKGIHVTASVIDTTKAVTDWEQKEIHISGCKIVRFPKNGISKKVDWTKPAMIIPASPNYPDADVMFFTPEDNFLLVCQFTVTEPFTKHSRNFFEMQTSGNLSAKWVEESKKQIKQMQMLWISTNVTATAYDNDWVVTSTQLEAKYPDLIGFDLA